MARRPERDGKLQFERVKKFAGSGRRSTARRLHGSPVPRHPGWHDPGRMVSGHPCPGRALVEKAAVIGYVALP